MAEPYNLLRSKLNRAITAYLVSVGAGGPDDVSPANSRQSKGYPNTVVRSTFSKPEIIGTGIRRITVHVSIKGSAIQRVGEPNDESARTQFDLRVGRTMDAMMQSWDGGQSLDAAAQLISQAGRAMAVPVDGTPEAILFAQNNSDMAEFTCQALYDAGEGEGEADAEGCDWEEVLIFDAVCCGSNTD